MVNCTDLFEAGRPTIFDCGITQSWPHPPRVVMVTGGGQGPSARGHKGQERSHTTMPRVKWLTGHLWTGKKQSTESNENESKTMYNFFSHFIISFYSFLLIVLVTKALLFNL